MENLNLVEATLRWLNGRPTKRNAIALLIPQYNESSKTGFEERLQYFADLADEFRHSIDVILIDDGSTDRSLEKIDHFVRFRMKSFFVASIYPNGNKVGALNQAAGAIYHEYVILSDFDTDLVGLPALIAHLQTNQSKPLQMGFYFKLVPFEGQGAIFEWQQLEYCLLRILYKFHERDRTVPVMPGAGCCFKRKTLLTIYKKHSGLRNGEDREATLIGARMGYSTTYFDQVQALTRPPLSFKSLVKQRIRWNLGYFETFHFERKYYFEQMLKGSSIGIRVLLDILFVSGIVLLPVILLMIILLCPVILYSLLVFYIGFVICSFWMLATSPKESAEVKQKAVISVVAFPAIKVCLDYISWTKALVFFFRNDYRVLKNNRRNGNVNEVVAALDEPERLKQVKWKKQAKQQR